MPSPNVPTVIVPQTDTPVCAQKEFNAERISTSWFFAHLRDAALSDAPFDLLTASWAVA